MANHRSRTSDQPTTWLTVETSCRASHARVKNRQNWHVLRSDDWRLSLCVCEVPSTSALACGGAACSTGLSQPPRGLHASSSAHMLRSVEPSYNLKRRLLTGLAWFASLRALLSGSRPMPLLGAHSHRYFVALIFLFISHTYWYLFGELSGSEERTCSMSVSHTRLPNLANTSLAELRRALDARSITSHDLVKVIYFTPALGVGRVDTNRLISRESTR